MEIIPIRYIMVQTAAPIIPAHFVYTPHIPWEKELIKARHFPILKILFILSKGTSASSHRGRRRRGGRRLRSYRR